MPKQQRTVRTEQKSQLAAMERLDGLSDEELQAETRYRAAAQAILGNRAAQRMDAKAARAHFQRAIAAARPQERMQLRRMADASLAYAERRADDLKLATQRLGVDQPTGRQLLGLRVLRIVAPPASAGLLLRIRGIVLVLAFVVLVLAAGFGLVSLVALATGGLSLDVRIFYGIALVIVVFVGLILWGRRRQKAAEAKRAEGLSAARGR